MHFLQSNYLPKEGFLNLLKEYPFSENALLIAFSPGKSYFGLYQFDQKFLSQTDHGRIFSPDGELKWRRLSSQIRVVYLGAKVPPSGLVDYSSKLEKLTTSKSELILWGTRHDTKDEWIEQQVPHRFIYPVSSNEYSRGRVAIVVENWMDSAGFISFSRYYSIKEIPEWKKTLEEEEQEKQEEKHERKSTALLPYRLKQIEVKNFQCIKETGITDLPDDTRWIFLLGENGSGKTAFLQALTIGICGFKNALNLLENQKQNCHISVLIKKDDKEDKKELSWGRNQWTWTGVERPDYFCAYGPSRLEILSTDQETESIDSEKSLLDQKGYLRNIKRWIIGQKLREASEPKAQIRRQNVMKLLESILPNVSEIKLEKDRLLCKEMGYWATLHEIASGHKSIIAMIGDMIMRLFEMQPEETDPKNLTGIVVIDELDVHIHPVFQREFPKLLSENFPRIQFICSTHSPIPLLGAPEGSKFFVVERDEENGTTVRDAGVDVRRLHPNALLTSPLFGLEKLFSENLNKSYHGLDPEDNYEDILKRKKLEKEIERDAKSGKTIPKELYKGLI
jgi:AAA15 family ATPase/GTPase